MNETEERCPECGAWAGVKHRYDCDTAIKPVAAPTVVVPGGASQEETP